MRSHDIKVCPHCRHSVKVLFEGGGFHFHWVGNYYCIDVLLSFEEAGEVVVVFMVRHIWFMGKEHERKRMRRG